MNQRVLTTIDKPATFSGLAVEWEEANLLLPVSAVAEAVRQVTSVELVSEPEWMYGWFDWREQRVPLLSYAKITGRAKVPLPESANVLVLNALENEDDRLPFYAVLIPKLPRAIVLKAEDEMQQSSAENHGDDDLSWMRFSICDQQYVVPDFAEIERRCRAEIPQIMAD